MKIRSRIVTVVLAGAAALALLVTTGGAAQAGGAPLDTSYFTIENNGTQNCLQPDSSDEFARVVQLPCVNTNPYQDWTATHDGGDFWHLKNRQTGMCMNEFDALAPSARVLMIHCARVSNEVWDLHTQTPTFVALLESRTGNTETQYCADAIFGFALLMNACIGSNTQYWTILFNPMA
jgi:hypothetical protein